MDSIPLTPHVEEPAMPANDPTPPVHVHRRETDVAIPQDGQRKTFLGLPAETAWIGQYGALGIVLLGVVIGGKYLLASDANSRDLDNKRFDLLFKQANDRYEGLVSEMRTAHDEAGKRWSVLGELRDTSRETARAFSELNVNLRDLVSENIRQGKLNTMERAAAEAARVAAEIAAKKAEKAAKEAKDERNDK